MVASAKKNNETVNRSEFMLTTFIQFLNKIPFTSDVKNHLDSLRSLIQAQRPARIVVIGRSRSGKSSLINAICGLKIAEVSDTKPETGKAEWQTFNPNGIDLVDILDTRGLQESQAPRQYDAAKTPTDSIIQAVNSKCPDIVLMLCKATEVGSASQEDINICELIIEHIKKQYNRHDVMLIPVLTQCDQLAPHKIDFPTDDERKNRNLNDQLKFFYAYLQQRDKLRYSLKEVVPTVAYAEYDESGWIIPAEDGRWNIDKLIETMMKHTPKERRGSIARMAHLKEAQVTIANTIVTTCVALSAASSISPVPGSSLIATNFIQSMMVYHIAWLGGREFSDEVLKDFVVTVSTLGLFDLALELIPGVGNVIRAGVNGAATKGIGDLAIQYYLNDNIASKQ
jgi:predicted GTPase